MGRRKLFERNIRKLVKTGRGKSYSITLPIGLIREFGWRERQKLELKANKRRKTILIKDWKEK